MTTPDPTAPPPGRVLPLREMAGLLLLVLGLAALVTVAFLTDPLLGVAAAGLLAVTTGVLLTTAEV